MFLAQGGSGDVQSAQIPGQHITAAALGEERIARAVEEDIAFASADKCLMAFQHNPTVSILL